jgi:NAD-dependent deacetylase
VLELHGTIHEAKCLDCGLRTPMQEQLDRVRAGDPDPLCSRCGGVQKSATIAFGEPLDAEVFRMAGDAAARSDLFLAIGTSLVVQPAMLLLPVAQRLRARCVIVNADPTPFDDHVDAVIREPIGAVLPRIVARAGGVEGVRRP